MPSTTPIAPRLLDGWKYLEDFAREDVSRHPRTVKRWTKQPNGLPYRRLGNRDLIHIETARTWLFAGMSRPNPRRRQVARGEAAAVRPLKGGAEHNIEVA